MPDLTDAQRQLVERRVGVLLKGKYKIESLLGVGGMSAVYLAVHRNGHRVAVKMLHPEVSADSDAQRRFLQEGYAANNVEHPGVVRVLDDDTAEDGSTFVVMELLQGETLGERAKRSGGVLPHRFVMDAAHQLLDVLAAAQAKGIVHRDIKPDNVFITTDGTLKLLDFGLARLLDDSAPGRETALNAVFGTPGFMPPEQAVGNRPEVDHQSDLWAVGATMFSLLSGKPVHEAVSAMQHLLFVASRPARPLASVVPDIPPAVAAIVDKALGFSKSERWPHARAMQQAIEAVFATLYKAPPPPKRGAAVAMPGASGPLPAVVIAPTLNADAGRRRARLIWAAALCAGALVVGLGIALGSGGGGGEPAPGASSAPATGASTMELPASTAGLAETTSGTTATSATSGTAATARTADTAPGSSTKAPGQPGPGGRHRPQRPPGSTKGAFDYQ
jgi:hypothetical protein